MLLIPGEVVKHSSETLFNKEEGMLFITNKRLAWCKPDSETPVCEVLHENFCNQQVSRAEAKKVMLRINALTPGSAPDSQPNAQYTFNWKGSDREAAIADRDKYVAELGIITARKAQSQQGAAGAGTGSNAPSAQSGEGTASTGAGVSLGQGGTEYGKVKIGAVPASAEEIKLRQEVLSKNEDLAKLHKTLVLAGLISEDEFWSTRKNILENQAIQTQLRKGESSTWLDLAPVTQASGDFKYTITPNVARRIFREFPQVKRAYIENVPHRVPEKEFWKRFVASQFFNRGRSADSARGSRDAIFEKCTLEEDAMFTNTSRHNLEYLTSLLDLTRTEEDSVETGNGPDITMRPPPVDKLTLIRRFNHHSELVLQSVLNSKRKTTSLDHNDVDKTLRDATRLEDLETTEPEKKVKLDIQDRSRYFTSLSKAGSNSRDEAVSQSTVTRTDAESARAALQISFNISRPLEGYGDTLGTMSSLSRSAQLIGLQKRPNRIQELCIPEELDQAVAECHGAGTEMLRHLWALLRLPLTPERQQRAERIAAAFGTVQQRIRDTIARSNTVESKNPNLGKTVEKMLQPITDSLINGKQAFENRIKTNA
ncbi:RNA polymerase II transcription factor B subunit 1 [Coemansia sp. RSA 1722]|nr:RNA polymerase II transcription factor B subunit 1 [Coemansia sp. RSA 486]KAJ2235233.1 RNA polymerase II transcription factor B subunit 1 [Coemansia sp. RSA 485]KAJ2603377.1 RNA polymerase II transcription factor B subunit 1 [Coemansia sp. RSA 1722]